MQYPQVSEWDLVAAPEPRPGLMLVPKVAAGPDPATLAAQARVRHALLRVVQEFLDRAGFTELERAPDAPLAALLERTCWPTRDGEIAGWLVGADAPALLDLLERGLLAGLQGVLNRAAADLLALGVDLDRLKYLRLPLRRVREADAPPAWSDAPALWPLGPIPAADRDAAVLAMAGEPVVLVQPATEDPGGAAGAALLGARLLLPGVGLVASANQDGHFRLDLPALTRFVCAAETARLARPALAGRGAR